MAAEEKQGDYIKRCTAHSSVTVADSEPTTRPDDRDPGSSALAASRRVLESDRANPWLEGSLSLGPKEVKMCDDIGAGVADKTIPDPFVV